MELQENFKKALSQLVPYDWKCLKTGFDFRNWERERQLERIFPECNQFRYTIYAMDKCGVRCSSAPLFQYTTFDNIVLFDVLHHLSDPSQFFCEMQKSLKQKGRIVFIEPYISWASFFIYRFLHPEGLVWNIDPYKKGCLGEDKNHFHGNQALPTLIFERYKHRFAKDFPGLKIIKEERMDFIIYPLSGGFHNPSLCPLFLYSTLEYLEKILHPLNRFLAFRLFVVLEKT